MLALWPRLVLTFTKRVPVQAHNSFLNHTKVSKSCVIDAGTIFVQREKPVFPPCSTKRTCCYSLVKPRRRQPLVLIRTGSADSVPFLTERPKLCVCSREVSDQRDTSFSQGIALSRRKNQQDGRGKATRNPIRLRLDTSAGL